MDIKKAVKVAGVLVSGGDPRPAFNGVHVVKKDGVVTVESTNGNVLFRTTNVDPNTLPGDDVDFIVIPSTFNSENPEYITDVQFPDFENHIPSVCDRWNHLQDVEVDIDSLLLVLESVKKAVGNSWVVINQGQPGDKDRYWSAVVGSKYRNKHIVTCSLEDTIWVITR